MILAESVAAEMADIAPTVDAPILVVDDDPGKRLALVAVLTPLGFSIVEADSGVAALRSVMAQSFAAILLDVRMPGMDGFETAALIRERRESEMTPIIFVTAFEIDEIAPITRYAEGAVDFMSTPVEPDELRAKVSVFANLYLRAGELATQTEEVRTSADQLRLLTEAAPIGIFQTDSVGRYVYTNPRWSQLTGISAGEAIGRDWGSLLRSPDRVEFITELPTGLGGRDGATCRFEIKPADSLSRVLLVTTESIAADDGTVARCVGTVADVTAEARANEERGRFQSLVQNSRDVIAVVDECGVCSYVSPATTEMSGFRPEEVVGENGFAFLHPDDMEHVASQFAEVLADPRAKKIVEVRTRTKGGDWIWIEIRAANRLDDPSIRGIVLNYHDITERRAAADRIAESERLLAEAQAISHFGSFVWDMKTDDLTWSDEQYRLFGYEPRSLRPTFDVFLASIHHEDRDEVNRKSRACLETGEDFEGDFRIVHSDGRIRWIHRRGVTTFEDGLPSVMVGTCQDITARKESERERSFLLAKQEELTEQFRLLLDSTGEGIYGIDEDGACTFMNRSGAALLGGTPVEFVGKNMHELAHHSHADGSPYPSEECPISKGLRSGLAIRVADEVLWKLDGTAISVEYSSHSISNGGVIQGAVVAFADVTARKEMETELRSSEQLFRGAFHAGPTGIALIGADGKTYVDVNSALCEMLGYSKEELLLKDWMQVTHPDDVEHNLGEVKSLTTGPEDALFLTKRYVRKNGEVISVEVNDSVVRRDDGTPMYFVTHIADVTERNKAAEQREGLEAQLRQSGKMEAVGQLAGGVAHDFNNLLAVILNYAEFIEESLENEEARDDLQQIIRAGERGAELVHQLLSFSRQEIVQPRVIDINEVVKGMAVLFDRSVGEDVQLDIDTPPGLLLTKADHGQLEQILLNLVVNARDSMSDGGRITITTANAHLEEDARLGLGEGQYVSLSVTDTGSGIDAETMDHMFEPFFTTKERGKGTGLGLSSAYGVVKQANGGIYAESEMGVGTSFVIYLPVTDEMPSQEIESSVLGPLAPAAVLVVEDEVAVRELIERILSREGFDVLAVASGPEAVQICTEHKGAIDLLLTDVVMPEMSGPSLRDLATPLRPGMKVLFMSGYTDELIAKRGVLDAGDMLLNKPFNSKELLTRVRSVLQSEEPTQVLEGSK